MDATNDVPLIEARFPLEGAVRQLSAALPVYTKAHLL